MELKQVEEVAKKIYDKEKSKQLEISDSILIDRMKKIFSMKKIIDSGMYMLGFSDNNYNTLKKIILSENQSNNTRVFTINMITLSQDIKNGKFTKPTSNLKSHIYIYNNKNNQSIEIDELDDGIYVNTYDNFNQFKSEIILTLEGYNKSKNQIANIYTIIEDNYQIYIQKKINSSWEVNNLFNFFSYYELKSRTEDEPEYHITLAA